MSETVLIIPDVHNRISRVERILKSESFSEAVFLGDWFDQFHDSPAEAAKVANFLKENLDNDKYHFIWGNHDISYSFGNQFCYCSGYTKDKDIIIHSILNNSHWDKFLWYYWLDDKTLLSHGGLSYGMAEKELAEIPTLDSVKKLLNKENDKASMNLRTNKSHWFYRAGRSRGGNQAYGGLLWADWEQEFESIDGIAQICGHTPRMAPEYKDDDNLCLDTHLNHYAVWNNGALVIKKYADL